MRIAKFILIVTLALCPLVSLADELNELSLDGWKKLREVERYQMQVAEKYWREQNFKAALAEYEKFMSTSRASGLNPFRGLLLEFNRKVADDDVFGRISRVMHVSLDASIECAGVIAQVEAASTAAAGIDIAVGLLKQAMNLVF